MESSFALQAFCRVVYFATILSWLGNEAIGADNFRVRKVTDLGHPVVGVPTQPLGALDDHLVFIAADGPQSTSIYRTDGQNVDLVDNTLEVYIYNSFGFPFNTVRLGDELYFTAKSSNRAHLYATNGQSVRLIPDSDSTLSSRNPHGLQLLNGQLLFYAHTNDVSNPGLQPTKLFRTDGTIATAFSVNTSHLAESAKLESRFVFQGISSVGATTELFSTDGQNLTDIFTDVAQPVISPRLLTRSGGSVYFMAGELSDRGLYRTDGLSATLVSKLSEFTFTNTITQIFELRGSTYLTVNDTINDELHFYRTNGETPTEVMKLAYSVTAPTLSFSNGERTFFYVRVGNSSTLHEFDGAELSPFSNQSGEFLPVGDRLFLNAGTQLFEVNDDDLIPLGPSLNQLTAFQGDLFGVNNQTGSLPFGRFALWHTDNSELKSLGSIVSRFPGSDIFPEIPFVEFNGQLYFGGIDGNDQQLFAVVRVPEPAIASYFAVILPVVYWKRSRVIRKQWPDQ